MRKANKLLKKNRFKKLQGTDSDYLLICARNGNNPKYGVINFSSNIIPKERIWNE